MSSVVKKAKTIDWVYVIDTQIFEYNRYGLKSINPHRMSLLMATLTEIDQILQSLGSHLTVYAGNPLHCIKEHINQHNIDLVAVNYHPGFYERKNIFTLKQSCSATEFEVAFNSSLLTQSSLPWNLESLPSTFTPFRKKIESVACIQPKKLPAMLFLPARCSQYPFDKDIFNQLPFAVKINTNLSGETAANNSLANYFASTAPKSYKTTRNSLEGIDSSTRLSHWLSIGCLSPNTVWQKLKAYEAQEGANESTYWIGFELLWREYFYWYALKYQQALFAFNGINGRKLLTSFYPSRFKSWCEGSTPFPLVNAIMKQLNATGFISNRARQITASCLVNELALDWRYGAAYFDQQLIDIDVASNWGNWQYIAGVGADPRGGRQFNLQKQQQLYDPAETFINRWQGKSQLMPIDNVNTDDWPIQHEKKD